MFKSLFLPFTRCAVRTSIVLGVLAAFGVTITHSLAMTKLSTSHEVAPIDPTCSSSWPCIEDDNNSSGPGVRGISVGGNGLAGATKVNSTSASNGRAGLLGNDISTSGTFNSGVHGLSVNGTGVSGNSTGGAGVSGTSTSGAGVSGVSTNGSAVVANSSGFGSSAGFFSDFGGVSAGVQTFGTEFGLFASSAGDGVFAETGNTTTTEWHGIAGVDTNNNAGDVNIGVNGVSNQNVGVAGTTMAGTGIIASATGTGTGVRIAAGTGPGLVVNNAGTLFDAAEVTTSAANSGDAHLGSADGTGVFAFGFATPAPGGGGAPALEADCENGAPAITAFSFPKTSDIMSLDCSGNMILSGKLTQNGTPLSVQRTATGGAVGTYVAQQAMPTIEDMGEARLVNGWAYVRMDPAFAATIDRSANYLVFITPQEMTQGTLCVTGKSTNGFGVRESQGGRSTIAFDYRIVAKPYDTTEPRLPLMRVGLPFDPSSAAVAARAKAAKADARERLARALALARRQIEQERDRAKRVQLYHK